jgi:hypothetical protein
MQKKKYFAAGCVGSRSQLPAAAGFRTEASGPDPRRQFNGAVAAAPVDDDNLAGRGLCAKAVQQTRQVCGFVEGWDDNRDHGRLLRKTCPRQPVWSNAL